MTSNPVDGIAALKKYWKSDSISGFIVSLIALPLCLGIALASGVPPMSGIIAGVVGGLLLSLTSGSYVTINGPAAGLAVIVLMSIQGFKEMAPANLNSYEVDLFAYQCTLAVGVGCGILQLLFGFVKAGILSNFFPSSVVHGMLAAIGIIIFAKQFHTAVGVIPDASSMLGVIAEIPNSLINMNPKIALIAALSLIILIVWPLIRNKYARKIPAALLTIIVAIPLGHYLNLDEHHTYSFFGNNEYSVGPEYLVKLPDNIIDGIVFPRFDYLFTWFGLQMVITYALVASLESLITAAAVDKLDPFRRKSNFNRELFAKGGGNIISSALGGLPIIAEVVRSSANINSGAVSRWSNFFHGGYLLLFILFLSPVIHQIPLSALAAMLMITGYRLASPKEFYKNLRIGKEQFIIFITTIIVTLVSDLLFGIAFGILVKLIIHTINGVPIKVLFKPFITIQLDDAHKVFTIDIEHSAVFSNLIGFQKQLHKIPEGKTIIIDFNKTSFVDDTFLELIHSFGTEYKRNGGEFIVQGLDSLEALSSYKFSSRKKIN